MNRYDFDLAKLFQSYFLLFVVQVLRMFLKNLGLFHQNAMRNLLVNSNEQNFSSKAIMKSLTLSSLVLFLPHLIMVVYSNLLLLTRAVSSLLLQIRILNLDFAFLTWMLFFTRLRIHFHRKRVDAVLRYS